jgi:hypothetical protein
MSSSIRSPLIFGRNCWTCCRLRRRLALVCSMWTRLLQHGVQPGNFHTVDSFDSVHAHCMPWLLDSFSLLQGCPRSRHNAVCSVLAAFGLLVGASVAHDTTTAGWREVA